MGSIARFLRHAVPGLLGLWLAGPLMAQPEARDCVVLLLHDAGSSPAAMAALGRKLQPTCTPRAPDMPWSKARHNDKDAAAAWQELGRLVKNLRRDGARRIVVLGEGHGANAALAYAGATGEPDAVVAIAPLARAPGLGELPAVAAKMRQHIPAIWVVGDGDPLFARGEAFAYAKAPPHPGSAYVVVNADHKGTPEAAVKPVLDWLKALE
ncbi:MAG: hypothetical protein KIS62_16590 [Ramlibacter sp.]|nr:hypothetical protein [Ramlibacter sp.]MBX3659566.1 hypothetical protein [Ramlibacter sp.]MCW5651368.1 hypothetical protein [Ramlibacter sp.]